MKSNAKTIKYGGDPALLPIRDSEVTFLVRFLHQLSCKLNLMVIFSIFFLTFHITSCQFLPVPTRNQSKLAQKWNRWSFDTSTATSTDDLTDIRQINGTLYSKTTRSSSENLFETACVVQDNHFGGHFLAFVVLFVGCSELRVIFTYFIRIYNCLCEGFSF